MQTGRERRSRVSSFWSGIFPGNYDLKVELSGFKSSEQKAIALSPNDNRGIDVRLEVGQQSETVTVTSQAELIQTRRARAKASSLPSRSRTCRSSAAARSS